ncbi:DNA topoisomerase [Fasciola gigantica]|uniref:DNA topoisomerase n=1 Tax=Fasciola gigantica TaxID=46835 RepID=A0A504Z075_FASGI|nr:DNA topoisomerase [Fasciola gigantica]
MQFVFARIYGETPDSRSFSTRTTQSSSLPAAGAVIGSNNSTTTFPSLSDWATGSTPLDDNESVVCHCGQQAIVLTVKKAGPNQGRLFYRCAGGMGSSCDFFQWKTAAPLPGDIRGPPPLASSTQL